MKCYFAAAPHPTRDRREKIWFVPTIIKRGCGISIQRRGILRHCVQRSPIAVLVIKRPQRRIRSLQKNIEPAPGETNIQVGNLGKYISHGHIEGASFRLGQATQVIDKVRFELQSILVRLFDEFLTAEAKGITECDW